MTSGLYEEEKKPLSSCPDEKKFFLFGGHTESNEKLARTTYLSRQIQVRICFVLTTCRTSHILMLL